MKRPPGRRMKARGDRFVVGYLGRGNCLFTNKRAFVTESSSLGSSGGIDPMTFLQARRLLKAMPCEDCAIFELVPVRVNEL